MPDESVGRSGLEGDADVGNRMALNAGDWQEPESRRMRKTSVEVDCKCSDLRCEIERSVAFLDRSGT